MCIDGPAFLHSQTRAVTSAGLVCVEEHSRILVPSYVYHVFLLLAGPHIFRMNLPFNTSVLIPARGDSSVSADVSLLQRGLDDNSKIVVVSYFCNRKTAQRRMMHSDALPTVAYYESSGLHLHFLPHKIGKRGKLWAQTCPWGYGTTCLRQGPYSSLRLQPHIGG